MAYITKEEVKVIRLTLKKVFPKIKFSVTMRDYSEVRIAIMSSNIDFSDILGKSSYKDLNPFYPENYGVHSKLIAEIVGIAKCSEYYDRSDAMTDYFDISYYINISIGKFDKPYKQV